MSRGRVARLQGGDSGWAMVTVMGLMMVLTLFVTVAVGTASDSIGVSRKDQDYHAAQDAAQAGVQDYLNRLNVNGNYYQLHNGPDPLNSALSTTAFKKIDGSPSSTVPGEYRYEMLNTPQDVLDKGLIELRSTGKVGQTTRVVDVVIGKRSFLDYLWFSDFETVPPITAEDPDAQALHCTKYYYSGRPPTCPHLLFSDGDILRGPVHSKDAIAVKGSPVFEDIVDTDWPAPGDGSKFYVDQGLTSPVLSVFKKGPPVNNQVDFPSSNTALAQQAASTGCVYTGPTRILFNPGGTMTVTSPYSPSSLGLCGTFTAPNYTSTFPVPQRRVFAVKSAGPTCAMSLLPVVKFPVTGDNGAPDNGYLPGSSKLGYHCNQGDLFVEGSFTGQATLYAENNLVVTGNLTYAGGLSGDDILGLVGDSVVAVYHPITCTSRSAKDRCVQGSNVLRTADPAGNTTAASVPTAYPLANVTIDAAILATQNGFLVQNHRIGDPLQTLKIRGAIAQRFRGGVGADKDGVHGHGYVKDYEYDRRLQFAPPPALANLATTAWEVKQFAEKGN